MKKLLLFVTMAASLLFTQCKKDDKNSMPSEGKTVSMTVTAGPGSKTDITTAGAITWSKDDKLYVGDGSKYIGYLTLKSGEGSATGVFTGNVTLDGTGEKTFHFFYLGSGNYTTGANALQAGTSTTVDVDFSSQNIYKDANNKKLENASKHHVGYGSAKGTVTGNMVTDINVMMESKVAIARFSFKKGDSEEDYEGALTLSGTNIYNSMTVGFDGSFTHGEAGNISLAGGHGERYVMLVPTDETTGLQTMRFASADFEGSATFGSGIEANKFYGRESAIEVKHIEFTVDEDGTKVKFAPGNLWYGKAASEETAAFHFESNQWDYFVGEWSDENEAYIWNPSHVSHFKWSDAKNAVTDDSDYSGGLFCASNFTVTGDSHTDWRTLTSDEWDHLMNTRTVNGGKGEGNSYQMATVNGVYGLILYPDNYTGQTTATSYTSAEWTSMESAGVVFLPAAGYRSGSSIDFVGSYGSFWSSTCLGSDGAYFLYFCSDDVDPQSYGDRCDGNSVRLVRAAQ